eukprot:scaffold2767_cov177-Amphora_coffeaeformis.AAC.92
MANPSTLYHNLASARVRDKGRLVAVVGVLLIILILPFILIAAKVNQTLDDKGGLRDATWAVLLTPIWAAFVLSFATVGLVMYLTKKVTLAQIVGLMERACWMSAIVLLVQRWDGNRVIENWHATSMPFYFAVAFRVLGQVIWIGTIQEEIKKMISVEHLQTVEAEMFAGMTIEDLQEEELAALHDRYHVVNPDPLHVVSALEILKAQGIDLRASGQEKELEAVRVQCSPEYQAASEQISEARVYAINMIIFGVPLIPLTAAKLNADMTASWWVVIMPLWVFWAVRMVWVCALCFGFGAGESVVMVDADDEEKETGEETGDFASTQEREAPEPPTATPAATPPSVAAPPSVPTAQGINIDDTTAEPSPARSMASVAEDEENHAVEDAVGSNENVFPTPYTIPQTSFIPQEEDLVSEAPSDEGAWRDSLPRDPPGVSSDDQELERLEMERRRQLFEVTQRAKVNAAPSPASTDAPVGVPEGNADTNTDDEHHQDEPGIDEDMFRQWQRMQEEGEQSAVEAQAKAQWLCCSTIFQIIMTCLLVGKLEHDYPRPADGSVGYSAFWILFPILLLACLILCCCSVLICATGDPNAMGEHIPSDGDEEQGEQQDGQQTGGAPEIFMAPPSTTPMPVPATPDIEAPAPAPTVIAPAPIEEEDMNELD